MSLLHDSREPRKLDVYARPFIPQYIRAVNNAPANIVPCMPAPWIDFDAYARTFTGRRFLTGEWHAQRQAQQTSKPSLNESKDGPASAGSDHTSDELARYPIAPQVLKPRTYEAFFQAAIDQEYSALCAECDEHALYKHPLVKTAPQLDPRPNMYRSGYTLVYLCIQKC